MSDDPKSVDAESNRLTGRLKRYGRVSTGLAPLAARAATTKIFGRDLDFGEEGVALAKALGGMKGPVMKIAQLVSTIPGLVPEDMAKELAQLQTNAPAMGWPFVRRRMEAELGEEWQSQYASFEKKAAAAASLGQVHRATSLDGTALACKLQYPDMSSAVEADIKQLNMAIGIFRKIDQVIDPTEITIELSERLREELDYEREAKHIALYRIAFEDDTDISIPKVHQQLSTARLLTMEWLDGSPLMLFKDAHQEIRNNLSAWLFKAWWHPVYTYGVIHGDPHLGNYAARLDGAGMPIGLNLYDYGCVRIFSSRFVSAVIELYRGLQNEDEDQIVAAYETWGFKGLSRDVIDILNVWARFIYQPLLYDGVFSIKGEDGGATQYGRQQALKIHKALKEKGPILIPREFVLMDRAAIGLGGVFTHMDTKLNFYQLFNEVIKDYDIDAVHNKQKDLLRRVGL